MTTTAATATAPPPQRGTSTLLEAPILPTLLRLTVPNLAAMLVVDAGGDLRDRLRRAFSAPCRSRRSRWCFR